MNSELESIMKHQMTDAGLPVMLVDHVFHDERKWRLDFASPRWMVCMEVEGGSWVGGRHNRPKGFEDDILKYNEAAIEGWLLVRATTGMVKDGRALSALERAFEAAGWEKLME